MASGAQQVGSGAQQVAATGAQQVGFGMQQRGFGEQHFGVWQQEVSQPQPVPSIWFRRPAALAWLHTNASTSVAKRVFSFIESFLLLSGGLYIPFISVTRPALS
ncbi:hypothetical protein GCM10023155_22440 [Bremerella cremea]